ncbi:phosphinothricin N-acetyltransferase, putative [Roseobacter sp. AzwK-3b]|uniref:GNAT family N-acetyltransferase n=1 Tax=Roseobacter sp. AzwK-3b TaxID=351016 RepID=UPI0001569857|nr:GNAT family N-acetyltransferase [Roseobacter sp. AzwK-3b]EDM71733.1 phosphinothricin N-acetyltransferase, putative [Roseobacter sp. AzwK-3b]
MILRDAEAADVQAIAGLVNPVIRDTTITFTTREKTAQDVADDIAAKRDLGHGLLVVEEAGALLGVASYGQFRPGPGYARTAEHSITLDPSARGRGLGRLLLHRLEDHARGAGMHSMIAAVSGENPGGVAFHERLGYARVAVLPQIGWKFGRWLDLILLQKQL